MAGFKLRKAITGLYEGDGQGETNQRRQVTVLFTDLTGFTRPSNELGAEDTHALLNRHFETVDGIIEGYGGTIDKHIGDNVMAVLVRLVIICARIPSNMLDVVAHHEHFSPSNYLQTASRNPLGFDEVLGSPREYLSCR